MTHSGVAFSPPQHFFRHSLYPARYKVTKLPNLMTRSPGKPSHPYSLGWQRKLKRMILLLSPPGGGGLGRGSLKGYIA